MEKKNKKNINSAIKEVLDITLKVEANSASCAVLYQPKEPKELERFKTK